MLSHYILSQACLVSTLDNTKHWFILQSELLVTIVEIANIVLLFWNPLQKSQTAQAIENEAKLKFKETKFHPMDVRQCYKLYF